MEKLINYVLGKKIIIYLLTVLIIIGGLGSLFSFNRELVPESNMPWINLSVSGGSLPPEEMEEQVTKPLEKEIKSLADVMEFSSTTRTGHVNISIQAREGQGAEVKQSVQTIVNRLRNGFPSQVENVDVIQADLGGDTILMLALSGDELPVLLNLANNVISDRIEAVENVKEVEIMTGNVDTKILINMDPQKLALYRMTPGEVVDQLRAANVRQSIGSLKNPGFETVIEVDRSFKTVEQIGDVPVKTPVGNVALRKLAVLEDLRGGSSDAVFMKNGQQYIMMMVNRAADSDVIKTAAAVEQVIDQINQESGGNYQITVVIDGASFISNAVGNLSRHVMIGGLLAVIILLVFLRNWRVTMVISTTIPLSVMMTFIALKAGGYNIDLVTLLSLSLSVGLMVDAAIVVLESIYHFREQGESLARSIALGTREVITPVLTSQLTIIVVFLPLVIGNLGGAEYKPIMATIAFTVTAAIVSATLAAVLFVPVFANSFLRRDKPQQVSEGRLDKRITRFFIRVLTLAMGHRVKTVLLAIVLLVGAVMLTPLVKTTTMLSVDESYVYASLVMPRGFTVADNTEVARQAAKELKELPELKDVYVEAYKEQINLHIMMKPKSEQERSKDEVILDINQRLNTLPYVDRVEVGFGGGADNTPVQLEVVGKDMEEIRSLAGRVEQMLVGIPGVHNPRSDFEAGVDKLTLVPRYDAMERLGVDEGSLIRQISGYIGEHNITTMTLDGQEVDVKARFPEKWMQHPEQLRQVMVASRSGSLVALGDLVDWKYAKTPVAIVHKEGERVVGVNAELAGSDLGAVGRAVDEQLKTFDVPEGYSVRPAGALKQQAENMTGVLYVFLGAIALIYIIMVAQFGRLTHPFIIMLSLPMAVVGVVVGLVLTQRVVNPVGMVGFIMLTGIVVSNAILLIDRINLLRFRGSDLREAIIEGVRNRVRPILMTKLTAILGLTPLALAYGEGAEIEAPIATVVIFGLIFHTLITLILVPVLYSLFEDFHNWRQKRKKCGNAPEETAKVTV